MHCDLGNTVPSSMQLYIQSFKLHKMYVWKSFSNYIPDVKIRTTKKMHYRMHSIS